MIARAAASKLPEDVPPFFRNASSQLVYLNPEPDRWRVGSHEEMDQAFAYDHYIDLENVPDGALDAPDRFEFLGILYGAGIVNPQRDVGFLPFRIVELYQRLTTGWRQWRAARDPIRRQWIAQRIVNDAGILGHYVADASQPHHTTIHFNGWNFDVPNPEGYTYDNGFHARFERFFVEAHVTDADLGSWVDVGPLAGLPGSEEATVRAAVMAHIMESHELVETLYRLDRDVGFGPEDPADPAAVDFAASRMASAADMLATLWWWAWLEGAEEPGQGPGG